MNQAPPPHIVQLACDAARNAHCKKSRRSVVIFQTVTKEQDPGLREPLIIVRGTGFNGPPPPICCDGSEACRKDCPKIAVHAERRALDWMLEGDSGPTGKREFGRRYDHHELVHVKVNERGMLVAGGAPSCAECSKHILDVNLAGVWLYEVGDGPKGQAIDEWRFYNALEFHLLTLGHERNKLYASQYAKPRKEFQGPGTSGHPKNCMCAACRNFDD